MLVPKGWFCVILYLGLFLLEVNAEVTVTNKAYQNIVVSFSNKIPPENATETISHIQQLLSETSSVLKTAIGLKIGSVIFNLPQTWDASALEGMAVAENIFIGQEANLKIDCDSESAFGMYPFTLQYSGCGVSGSHITIQNEFLKAENSYPKGKLLAREWLKYRYGVFDENGFQNDSMYPSYYSIAGSDDIHVTDCTFPEVGYQFRDLDNNTCSSTNVSHCSIHPIEAEAKSSLMFYHEELRAVDQVCGGDKTHNLNSPNKHNILCNYKSILEIVKMSKDFTNENSYQVAADDEIIQFSYIQEKPKRYIVAWQNERRLKNQEKLISNTVRKLLYDFPLQSKVGLYSYKDDISTVRPFAELVTDADRDLSLTSTFNRDVESCATCVVNKAADDLIEDSKDEPGTIVVLTAVNPAEDNALIEKLKNSGLCLVVMGFPDATKEGWAKLTEISTCSSFQEISAELNEEMKFENIYKVLESILPLPLDDTRTKTVKTGWLSNTQTLTISPDETAASFSVWIYDKIDTDDIQCKIGDKDFNITPGIEKEPIRSFSFPSSTEEVKCNLPHIPEPHFTQIQMTTKPGAYMEMNARVYDTTPEESEQQMPVIIYANLNYGSYPIRDAKVEAVITSPNGQETKILLSDDGKGDPDITRNDGIYSQYFIEFDSEGKYTVNIQATDNEKQAKFGKSGKEPCCGSAVISDAFDVPEFSYTLDTDFQAISSKPEEGYKPSKILDLKVESIALPNSVTLKWTAPGGEMNQGKASSYEFSMFCQHEDFCKDGVLPNWIRFASQLKLMPLEYGREQKEKFLFLMNAPDNTTISFAVAAVNSKNQHSDRSNLISIRLPPNKVEELTTPGSLKDRNPSSPKVGAIVAYVIIALSVLFLIGGAIIFMMERTKRKRKLEDLNTPDVFYSVNGQANPSFPFKSPDLENGSSIRRVESFPVLLYTHDQIKDCKGKVQDPPLFKAGKSPKEWTSMDVLASGTSNTDSKSLGSTSQMEENNPGTSEITQLDNISQNSEPKLEKDSKF